MNTYYKARLVQDEDGSNSVWFDEWNVIYETKCFVYCLPDFVNLSEGSWCDSQRIGPETNSQLAKRLNLTLKRVYKQGSRFAFATKEEAFKRLKFMKSYHVRHLRHQLRCVEEFIQQSQGKTYEEYEQTRVNELVPVIMVSIPAPWDNKDDRS